MATRVKLRRKLALVQKTPLGNLDVDYDAMQLGTVVSIRYHESVGRHLDQTMRLLQENMGDFYRRSTWGWDPISKKRELTQKDARFLIVTCETGDLVGFVHFRFVLDDEEDPTEVVLYLYELQIASLYRGRGIGSRCMRLLEESVAGPTQCCKVMLTVFRANQVAWKFYRKLGYTPDPTSPNPCKDDEDGEEEYDYGILSKVMG